ncbi:hypothetical protein F4813DRAFT_387259 [Daldinia decipiens]|uniref:uncharacterized protein n=1 Tax=Daldinia decipiens TaxID=326647 RepID=UPI0020C3EB08|nr:uncharacterized protein F4813DRAFT_387259 [Daldinia decipiens]KAI1659766.1 hypothetical protein F4813DRAFT_387259 [Daldinia decipiens]
METSSLSSPPPASPLRRRKFLQPPRRRFLHSDNAALPTHTSESTNAPNAISSISSDKPAPSSYPTPEEIATNTYNYWRLKRRNGYNFARFMEGCLLSKTSNGRNNGKKFGELAQVLKNPLVQERLKAAGVLIRIQGQSDQINDEGNDEGQDKGKGSSEYHEDDPYISELRKELSILTS